MVLPCATMVGPRYALCSLFMRSYYMFACRPSSESSCRTARSTGGVGPQGCSWIRLGTLASLQVYDPPLWASAVLFLLLNVRGWHTIFWVSLMPLIIILSVGTKLQAIITRMALEIKERHVVVQGMPVVQLSDQHFWFGSPHLVLLLIHLTLFQNAFQIIYFLWTWYEFGLNSCFNQNLTLVIVRIFLGVGVQVLCSYVTLPLYALVSQMGSHMKKSIFDEQTSKALMNWHKNAKKKQGGGKTGNSPSGGSPPESPTHRLKADAAQSGQPMVPTVRKTQADNQEMSEMVQQTVKVNDDIENGSIEKSASSEEQHGNCPMNLL